MSAFRSKTRVTPVPPLTAQPARPKEAPSAAMQELWFATRRRPWTRLALVPANPGTSVVELANSLALVGGAGGLHPLRVLSGVGLGLTEVAELVRGLETEALQGPLPGQHGLLEHPGATTGAPGGIRTLIPLDSIIANPLVTAVALCCDAVVLCLEYGVSDLRSAHKTVEQIGRERFVGSVVLRR